MENQIDMSVEFAGLKLANPVWTASGTCGYADELGEFMDVSKLGGFITKSVTIKPRQGNPTPRIVETDNGMLNAIGLANVGVDEFIAEKLPALEKMSCAVFVNIAGETIEDYVAVAQRLCEQKVIAGFELNISCPNVKQGGITFGTQPALVKEITSAVKSACGSKMLMVKLTPSVTDIAVTAKAAVEGGADALSLINTFTAMVIDIETRKPVLAKIPILGMGGIRTASDAIEFILAGATAVAVGTSNFVEPNCTVKIIDGIHKYCDNHGVVAVRDLIGKVE